MLHKIMLFLIFVSLPVWAEIGKVVKIAGAKDAFLVRNKERLKLAPELPLEVGDQLVSSNSHLMILIYPATQMSLPKKSQLYISQAEVNTAEDGAVKATSTVKLLKGMIRAHVTKQPNQQIEQKIVAQQAVFGVRGTEYEVSMDEEGVDLDVLSGSVNVSSMLESFAPKLVGANEAFRFSPKLKELLKKNFSPRFNDHPGFLNPSELKGWFTTRIGEKVEEKVDKKMEGTLDEKLKDKLVPDVKDKLKGFFD